MCYLSLSLSLSIYMYVYIYIYIHIHTFLVLVPTRFASLNRFISRAKVLCILDCARGKPSGATREARTEVSAHTTSHALTQCGLSVPNV